MKPDGKYTKDISGVVADPNGGFLVGGVSEACSDSSSDRPVGAGLSQARTSVSGRTKPRGRGVSLARTCTARTVPARKLASVRKSHLKSSAGASQVVERQLASLVEECNAKPQRRTGRPQLVQWVQAGYARCSLCPFRYKTTDAKVAQVKLAAHFRTRHKGCKPAGLGMNNRMPSLICDLSPDQAAEWRCPYCSKGISFEAACAAGKQRIAPNKMQHKREFHPRVAWQKWRGADYVRRGCATGARFKGSTCSAHRLDGTSFRAFNSLGGPAGSARLAPSNRSTPSSSALPGSAKPAMLPAEM